MNKAVPAAGAELVPLQAELQVRGWAGGARCWAAVWTVGCCARPAQHTWQCREAQPWINNSHGFTQVYVALEVQKSSCFFSSFN